MTVGTNDVAARRSAYLSEVLPLLYPAPCEVSAPGTQPAAGGVPRYREFVVLPDLRRARLLAPTDSRRLTVGAVRRYSEPQSRSARLKRQAVIAAVRSGTAGLLLRDRASVHVPDGADHIERYLSGLLGRDLVPSIHIGPARANRKPVLQLLDADGGTVAFVKMGVNELTRGLVRTEARALLTLSDAGFAALRIPRVLATGTWRGHEVLATSALPVSSPRVALPAVRLAAAMREVSGVAGIRRERLAGSRYWVTLRARLAPLTATDDGRTLSAVAHELVASHADVDFAFGSWHGDWTPWNMASIRETLLVWDWERFTTGVPVGFDPLHYRLQRSIVRDGMAPRPAVARYLADAPGLLDGFGAPPRTLRATALLYLIDLAARYLTDKQAEAGARLGVLGSWLLPELVAGLAAVSGTEPSPKE